MVVVHHLVDDLLDVGAFVARRPAHDPAHRALGFVGILQDMPEVADLAALLAAGPVLQLVVIGRQPLDCGPLDIDADVAPRVLAVVDQMLIGDVEATNHTAPLVGDDDLLVVAQQIGLRDVRLEFAEMPAVFADRVEEGIVGFKATEIVDDQADRDAAVESFDQHIEDLLSALVGSEGVVVKPERPLCGFDQPLELLKAFLSVLQKFENLVTGRDFPFCRVDIRRIDLRRVRFLFDLFAVAHVFPDFSAAKGPLCGPCDYVAAPGSSLSSRVRTTTLPATGSANAERGNRSASRRARSMIAAATSGAA